LNVLGSYLYLGVPPPLLAFSPMVDLVGEVGLLWARFVRLFVPQDSFGAGYLRFK